MTHTGDASVHASAVLVDNRAVLIRGPSGSGKSHLAFDLILAGRAGQIPKAVLIGDDRVHLQASNGQLMVRPARELAGLIEIRGLGIRRCEFAQEALVGLVVDLCADDAERLPPAEALQANMSGVLIPRIPVGRGFDSLPIVLAALIMAASSSSDQPSLDCSKGIGNHMSPNIAIE
jgi:serine kinase of HPr protein (carbohydrate metabolism regulator)